MAFSRREALILGGAGLAAGAAGLALRFLLRRPETPASVLKGARFIDLSGRPRHLSEWKGKILVCNFWATWCPPCRREIPMLVRLHTAMATSGVEFVGIAVDSGANVRNYAAKAGITYPVLLAGNDGLQLLRKLGDAASALPYTVVLDREGALAYRHLGALQRAPFEHELRRLAAA